LNLSTSMHILIQLDSIDQCQKNDTNVLLLMHSSVIYL